MRRFVRIGGGLALAILFAALLVRNVDLGQVVLAASRISIYVLAASAALVIAGYAVRARRWQLMLRGAGVNATYRQAAPIFFASFALNNVVPLRAGDLYRCVSTLQLPAGTMAKSLGTLVTERLLDLGALIMLLSALLLFLPQARLELISLPIAALLIVALVLIAALITFPVATWQLVETGLLQRFARFPVVAKVATWMRALTAAIQGTLSDRVRIPVVVLTFVAWSLELGVFVLVGTALSGKLLLLGGLGAGVLGTLATLIPSAPGHVGTFDFFAAQGFRYGGLDAEAAVAAALVCHLAIIVPVTLFGSLQLLADRQASLNAS